MICRRAGNTTNGTSGSNMSPIFHHQQQQQQQRRPLLRRGNSFHLDETMTFPESSAFSGMSTAFSGKKNKRQRNDERFMTRTRLRPGGPAPPPPSYGTPQPALKREVFNGTTFLRLNNNKDAEDGSLGGLEMAASSTAGYFTPLVKQKTLAASACESPRVQPVAAMMRTTRVVYNEAPPARGMINHEAAV